MIKKILSAVLALALCVGMAVPAFASEASLKKGTDVRSVLRDSDNTVYAIGNNGKVYKWNYDSTTSTFSKSAQILTGVKNPVQLTYCSQGIYVLDAEGSVYFEGASSAKTDASDIAQIAANNSLIVFLKTDGSLWVSNSNDGLHFIKYESLSDIIYLAVSTDGIIATNVNSKHYKLEGSGSEGTSGLIISEITALSGGEKIATQFFSKLSSQNAYVSGLRDFVIYDDGTCAWLSPDPVGILNENGELFTPLLAAYVSFDEFVEKPSSWAEDIVAAATAAGLVPDHLQSEYSAVINRYEFCALAVALYELATGSEIKGRVKFDDVNDINVEKAAAIKVVDGVGNNMFNPHGNLTREQAATMLSRLAVSLNKALTAQAPTFSDNTSISSWAFDAVGQVQAAEIMSGVGDNKFAPKSPYTREQSIATILRLYNSIK